MKSQRKRINPDTIVLLKHIGMGFFVLTGAVLLIAAVWYGTRVEMLTISEVQVSGGETIEHGQIANIAKLQLEGAYLGLVPRTFTWTYPRSAIITALEEVERVHDISIERKGGKKLLVTFKEHVPKALWCDEVGNESCLFLDETGYAFGHAPALTGGSFLRFIKTSQSAAVGESLTTKENFDDLFLITDLLSQQNWYVSQIEIDLADDAFLEMVDGGELKITLNQTPEETADNLFVVVNSEEFGHVKPGNFQYIDLRYGNKVFVNEELAAPQEETTASDKSASSTTAEESE
jgi:cell division septal protein FtsQ